MDYLLTKLLSQDHLELTFSLIRSMGGLNDLQDITNGNCAPINVIPFLNQYLIPYSRQLLKMVHIRLKWTVTNKKAKI